MERSPRISGAAARIARRLRLAITAMIVAGGLAVAQTQSFNPSEETPEEFPAGPGREETFYTCVACHNFKLVAAQGMSRRQWDESIELMVQRHGMPRLDDADRKVVLDYLEKTYPPRAPAAGGWQNPFLKR
jgi:mono/diheme cytochrome c family protein